jgi:hypothetical protein
MSCVLPNRETLNTLLEKGLDPLDALTQMEIMYSEISGLESSFDFKRNNISDATMKDVNAFMKSEEYTEELKQVMQPFYANLTGLTGEKGVNANEARGLSNVDGAYTNTTAGEISLFDPKKIT